MDEKSKRNGAGWLIVVILVMLLAYPLSLGPMVWLHDRGYLSVHVAEMLEIFYSPLEILSHIPAAEHLFEVYISFWEA